MPPSTQNHHSSQPNGRIPDIAAAEPVREQRWQPTVTGRVRAVGRASRSKSQRRQGVGQSRADFEKLRDHRMLLTGMRLMIDMFEAEEEREDQARRAWH